MSHCASETRAELLRLVDFELARQDEKWGEQNHPLIGSDRNLEMARAHYASMATAAKADNDLDADMGTLGWDGILLEEVFEALEAECPGDQEDELLQVAAVAVQAVASLRRQRGAL